MKTVNDKNDRGYEGALGGLSEGREFYKGTKNHFSNLINNTLIETHLF